MVCQYNNVCFLYLLEEKTPLYDQNVWSSEEWICDFKNKTPSFLRNKIKKKYSLRQMYWKLSTWQTKRTPCLPTQLTEDFAKEPEASDTWKYILIAWHFGSFDYYPKRISSIIWWDNRSSLCSLLIFFFFFSKINVLQRTILLNHFKNALENGCCVLCMCGVNEPYTLEFSGWVV